MIITKTTTGPPPSGFYLKVESGVLVGLGLGLAAVKACVWHFVEMQRPSSISLGLGQVFHNWHFYNQGLTRDDVKWVGNATGHAEERKN